MVRAGFDVFDRRLNADARAPIAVALSGGGDSLMALKLTKAWADLHGRPVIALSVDHRLQAPSGQWIEQARAAAERLGAGFQALAWDEDKPSTGLPAAARAARHRLIANAARGTGANVVVFGHTADDVIEGELMRAEGLRMGVLREWSPSPAWPEGRGVFLLRPLLSVRRADIRQALIAEGESWIDDPANDDPRSPRARVRPRAAMAAASRVPPVDDEVVGATARTATLGAGGTLVFERSRLRAASDTVLRRLIGAALACAGGQAGPPRGRRLAALITRLNTAESFVATLGGAKIVAGDQLHFVRDAGEARRGGLAPLSIGAGQSAVWDGRFEIIAGAAPVTVGALAGRMKRLPKGEQILLRTMDSAIRPALPMIESDGLPPTCPILAKTDRARTNPLVGMRFLAACGVISKEAAT